MRSISTRASFGRRATWTVARAGYGLGEIRPVDVVHRSEVVHVGQEDRRSHDVGERAAAGLQDRGEVVEHAAGLRLRCRRRRSGRWPDRAAPDPTRTAAGLRERPESTGRSPSARRGWKPLLHASTSLAASRRLARPCFDHFAGAEAARADAHAFVAAVDDRLDRLQIRLEPPRAHVVRVAVLPAHNRTLSAKFTSLGHDYSTFLRRNPDYTRHAPGVSTAGQNRRRPTVVVPARVGSLTVVWPCAGFAWPLRQISAILLHLIVSLRGQSDDNRTVEPSGAVGRLRDHRI